MNHVDSVNHWDLPVTEFKPRQIQVRIGERAPSDDPDVELWALRRHTVTAYDFYRHRPDRAATVARYAFEDMRAAAPSAAEREI